MFDDIGDFLKEEQRAQDEAALRIPPWAATIKVGDFVTREHKSRSHTFRIWSEVLPMTEEDEEGNEIEGSYEGHAYRFTRSFSVICPDGELGDVHLSVIERIVTRDEFEAARARGWK